MKIQRVQLDKERKVIFNNMAIMELEDKIDMSVTDLMSLINDKYQNGGLPKFKIILSMLWAGLLEHENLTFDEVSKLLPYKDLVNKVEKAFEPVVISLSEALGADVEVVEEEQKKTKKKKKASASKS